MNLWLEEDQSDCGKDLMDLVMMNNDASHCLLVSEKYCKFCTYTPPFP